MCVMTKKRYWIVFFCLYFFVASAHSGQLAFRNQADGNNKKFYYTFTPNTSQFTYNASFMLANQVIDEAYNLIPPLSTIISNIYGRLPLEAKQFADAQLAPWRTQYKVLVEETQSRIAHLLHNSAYPPTITARCPEQAFVYSAHSTQNNFRYGIETQSCRFVLNDKRSNQLLQERIRSLVASANNDLPENESIVFNVTNSGYSLRSRASPVGKQRFAALKESIVREQQIRTAETTRVRTVWQEIVQQHKAFFQKAQQAIPNILTSIDTDVERSVNETYANYYLRSTSTSSGFVLQLDYRRIAQHFAPSMHNVAQTFNTSRSIRTSVERMLLFAQTIPYSRLQGREVSGFQGYLTPPALLDANKGDCDSKSVLVLALARALFPNLPSLLILIEEHAFVAFAVPAKAGDMVFTHQGVDYVVAEPAGPATSPLGKASKQSTNALANGAIEAVIVF